MAMRPGTAARFWALSRPVFRSPAGGRVLSRLALLFVFLLGISGLNVLNSYVGRDFMTAVAGRQADRFLPLAALYAGVFLLSTAVAVTNRFTEERLGLFWRRWLTGHLIGRYFSAGNYRAVAGRGDIDNPDQRMTEDVRTFTTNTLSLLLILLNASITLVAFGGVLWSLTPGLVLAAVTYAGVGTLVTALLGRRLVRLDFFQLKKEADLRRELILANQAAAAGTLNGSEVPEAEVERRLDEVVENQKRVIGVSRNMGFFTTYYSYLIQLVPILIVGPMYMRGEVEFGAVTQAAMAFAHVMGAFSLIITEFGRLSMFAAVVARLGALNEALADPPREPAPVPVGASA